MLLFANILTFVSTKEKRRRTTTIEAENKVYPQNLCKMEQPTTIVIVEDLADVREHLENLLDHSTQFQCVGAFDNGDTALLRLPELKPHIVILDINLPNGANGLEVLRKIRPVLPDTEFLMFTIFEDDNTVFEALTEGAVGYLLKGTPDDKLLAALSEIANGGSPMTPRIARQVLKLFQKKTTKTPNMTEADWELTATEERILKLLDTGASYTEISDVLRCSEAMVKHHIHKIYKKLHARNRTDALNTWREWLKQKFS